MGIYDRDYYREAPTIDWDTSAMVKRIAILFVIVHVLQLATSTNGLLHKGILTRWTLLDPQAIFHSGQIWRLVTSNFLHYHPWALFWDILFLWFLGKMLEERYHAQEFLAFFLVSGVVGNFLAALTALGNQREELMLGAGACMTGMLVLCALHFPHRTMTIMYILPVPLWLLCSLYVMLDVFRLMSHPFGAVLMPIGGAGFAFLYYQYHWNLSDSFRGMGTWISDLRKPRTLKIYRSDESDSAKSPSTLAIPPRGPVDEQLEAKADAVLEKMNRHGKDSLTTEDWDILHKASERFRGKKS